MNRQSKIRLIQTVCWVGVAADALWTVALLWPTLFTLLTGRTFLAGDTLSMRLIAGTAASLMAGWTVLLAWTARKPINRRAVLAFTAMPVVAGLFCVSLTGYLLEQAATGWILVKTAGLFGAMGWAFVAATKVAKENDLEIRI